MLRTSIALTLLALVVPAAQSAGPVAREVARIEGFDAPESIVYDAALDLYFVSNIRGGGAQKDNNGFISRVVPDRPTVGTPFIAGGRDGTTLHAPKGLAVSGTRLWVADIDTIRAFDTRTAAPGPAIDLAPLGATFLNGIAAAPDGSVYVSETAIRFDADGRYLGVGTFRIFRIDPSGKASVWAEGASLDGPNGLVWDSAVNGLLVASFRGKSIYLLRQQERTPVASDPGEFDGFTMTPSRGLIASSHADGGLHLFENKRHTILVTGLKTPAGIAFDSKRNLILVPSFSTNDVRVWHLRVP